MPQRLDRSLTRSMAVARIHADIDRESGLHGSVARRVAPSAPSVSDSQSEKGKSARTEHRDTKSNTRISMQTATKRFWTRREWEME